MAAHATVDQRHTNAGASIARLPRESAFTAGAALLSVGVNGRSRLIYTTFDWFERLAMPLPSSTATTPLTKGKSPQDRAAKFHHIIDQATQKAKKTTAIHLRSGRVLHDDLRFLGRRIVLQIRRYFRVVGVRQRHRNDQHEKQEASSFFPQSPEAPSRRVTCPK